MINYSTFMWKNPLKEDAVELAYGTAQIRKSMNTDEFIKHVAAHNTVFSKGTIKGVLADITACIKEQLLNGNKVSLEGLGTISISLRCKPAESLREFTANNIEKVNVLFSPAEDLENLRQEAEFHLVTSRAIQQASLKALKAGVEGVEFTGVAGAGKAAANPKGEEV